MTTEQTMLNSGLGWRAFVRSRLEAGIFLLATLAIVQLVAGCASSGEKLTVPQALMAPYDTSRGDVLWAVVPLRNESGFSQIDVYQVSDKIVSAAAQVRGIRCLPLNRTVGAMRSLDLMDLANPEEALKLAAALGVDGIIVGSITGYDPYNPPKLGLALALYSRPGLLDRQGTGTIDTRKLTYQPTDYHYFTRSGFKDSPESVVSEFMDGKNHQVQMDVQRYASGRSDPTSALAWKRYLASMDLFCEFGAWQSVGRLLDHEWLRVARMPVDKKQP